MVCSAWYSVPSFLRLIGPGTEDLSRLDRRPQLLVIRGVLASGLQDRRRLSHCFFTRVAGRQLEPGVHVLDDAVAIGDEDAVGGLLNRVRQPEEARLLADALRHVSTDRQEPLRGARRPFQRYDAGVDPERRAVLRAIADGAAPGVSAEDRRPEIFEELARVVAGVADPVVRADQFLARVSTGLAEAVVHVQDRAVRIRQADEHRLLEDVAHLVHVLVQHARLGLGLPARRHLRHERERQHHDAEALPQHERREAEHQRLPRAMLAQEHRAWLAREAPGAAADLKGMRPVRRRTRGRRPAR
jgi:hypothetical protein